jgi:hypothetical protein
VFPFQSRLERLAVRYHSGFLEEFLVVEVAGGRMRTTTRLQRGSTHRYNRAPIAAHTNGGGTERGRAVDDVHESSLS